MKKTIFAGVLALAALGMLSGTSTAFAAEHDGIAAQPQERPPSISRGSSACSCSPRSRRPIGRRWRPRCARWRAGRRAAEPTGLVRRISHRVVSIVLDSAAIRRLAVAARPLIATLRDDQKQMALGLAQEMGLGPVLAALN